MRGPEGDSPTPIGEIYYDGKKGERERRMIRMIMIHRDVVGRGGRGGR
jgi:hypothetical protein